jgi:hypothetical protein
MHPRPQIKADNAPLPKRAILPQMDAWIATEISHENHVGARGEECFRADD